MSEKINILFLCTGNSCRSQMAEAWTRKIHGNKFNPYSAGVVKTKVDPRAIKVMAEEDLDISGHSSKLVEELPSVEFQYVITLCGHAKESCPFFPGSVKKIHMGFDDPPSLAQNAPSEEQALVHYRRVRDEIKKFISELPQFLENN
ncbi:MAG: arsenate reductase ArsC [Desulfonatronovibrio sp.]